MAAAVRYEARGGIATVTLARPEVRNALGVVSAHELKAALGRAAVDASVRLVLIEAEGPAFCAGMDLKSVDLADPSQAAAFAAALADVYEALMETAKPVLCAVDGPVSGGGVGLPAAADLVWAGPGAKFSLPETRLGLVPALVSVPLRRRISAPRLTRMALGGAALDADQAVATGLADFHAPRGAGPAARAFAESMLREHATGASARTKQFLARHATESVRAELDEARREFVEAVGTDEARRGLDAFRRKEAVRWDA
jgi:enoyl-CoA hydratase/carnithine racemase